ncbi:hypothetical protein [Sphingomonas sp. SUN039]|uniref:hypothetical protein n=1 Tax=Sphingomonas sp. SUN039 TaxID=2937787 RepID=UPI0021643C51|nr:hypothetical protein [Sphingomonas sp. SUN039]UVO54007.1 hypothetical protein M0209_07685 [Sphingomonas sp. SUN039]
MAAPAYAASDDTIVVTAKSLKQTAADLAACLARNCPPDQDVKATLAHAENQFVAGDYKNARTTLLKSVARNRKHGDAYPIPVSDLMRGNARVAAHLGEGSNFQSSTIASRDILRKGFGANDAKALVGDIEVGDMRAKLGYPDEAERIYKGVGERAAAANLPWIVSATEIRQAMLKLASELPTDQKEGRDRLVRLSQGTDPAYRGTRIAAKILLARSDRKAGRDDSTTKALLAEYAAAGGTQTPTLLFAAPIKQAEAPRGGAGEGRTQTTQLATKSFDGQWFDIGFWITPDGHTSEIEVIRKSGADNLFVKPVIDSIQSRVYAPLKREPGDPGVYAVERYSMTSLWVDDNTGTRIRMRSPVPRIERMDLTPDQIVETPKSAGTTG